MIIVKHFQILYLFIRISRTEDTAAERSRAGSGGGGDAEDGVDLVDDHVPDHADDEVLHQSSVSDLVGLALLSRDGTGEGQGADEESNEEGLDHVGGSNDWTVWWREERLFISCKCKQMDRGRIVGIVGPDSQVTDDSGNNFYKNGKVVRSHLNSCVEEYDKCRASQS